MPGNRLTHNYRMASVGLLIAVLLVMLTSPASAEIIVDTELSERVDTSVSGTQARGTSGSGGSGAYEGIQFPDISRDKSLYYIVFELPGNHGKWKDTREFISTGRHDFEYEFNGKTRPGVLYVARSTNLLGHITNTKLTVFLNDWNTGTLTGAQYVPLPFIIYEGGTFSAGTLPPNAYAFGPGTYRHPNVPITVTEVSAIPWVNQIKIDELDNGYEITLNREIYNQAYKSTILVNKTNEIIYQSTLTGQNEQLWFSQEAIDLVTIISPSGQGYPFSLTSASVPDGATATATVYVRSSATGAFVSNALVNATHLETGESQEKLLPSGSGTFSLIPSTGEVANYEFNVTAPGYHDHILRLLVSGDMSIPVNLMPTGAELPENQTTLKFTIHQSTGGWLPGATVQLNDGRSGLTNAAGYCEFVVEKNSTISYSVKKTGFYPLSGSVVMGIYERVILHSLIPTDVPLPTPTDPDETPGATPTPDTRTNEEKGQAVIDMIADNAEGLGALALICLLMGLLKLIAKW